MARPWPRSPDGAEVPAYRAQPAGAGPFDFILLATQPQDVERSARNAAPVLAPDGRIVCLQNGLCEYRVRNHVDSARILGAVVTWGGNQIEPGLYDRTSAGGFVLGRLDGKEDPRAQELARLLECIGPTSVTQNLAGARWSKLAINCAISTLGTQAGARQGAIMTQRFVRRLALEIMTEAVEVARAEKVKLEKPIVVDDPHVFVSAGYGVGCRLLEVTKDGDAWKVDEKYKSSKFKPKFMNPVLKGDYIYGLDDGEFLMCIAWKDGAVKWRSKRGMNYGHGQLLLVDDLLIVQCEEGDVALVEAKPDAFNELGRFTALPTGVSWNQPVLWGTKLLVRNNEEAACYEWATE